MPWLKSCDSDDRNSWLPFGHVDFRRVDKWDGTVPLTSWDGAASDALHSTDRLTLKYLKGGRVQ